MSVSFRRLAVSSVLGAALSCIGWPAYVHGQDPLRGTLRGQVVDAATGAPVAGALVEVLDFRDRIRRSAQADSLGHFVVTQIDPGSFWVRASRLGYATTKTPGWMMERGDILTVNIRLDTEVVVMAPMEIVGTARRTNPVLSGFHARVQTGNGTYITRDAIRDRDAHRVTDLLQNVPGLHVHNITAGSQQNRIISFSRSLPGLGGSGSSCPVQLYVDGVLATRSATFLVSPDELALPTELEGIEVYRGLSTVPAEFLSPEARCGVVAMWTRRSGSR